MKRLLLIILICFLENGLGIQKTHLSIQLNQLDPYSVQQHASFYELYPDTPEGKKALDHLWKLLYYNKNQAEYLPLSLPSIVPILDLSSLQIKSTPSQISEEQLEIIEQIGAQLPHHNLKGHNITCREELLHLEPEEVDLARAVLVEQLGDNRSAIRQYEAILDFISLQILARIPPFSSAEKKIQEINRFIFEEMRFRFPPHSIYAKKIDLYTFLPSVIESRQGVCLGISILYLSLAQRIGINLEIATPPGHIYLRYRDQREIINIETTSRGINLSSENYLGIDTKSIVERNIKEVIGLSFINQASHLSNHGAYGEALALYLKAQEYLPKDASLQLFVGLNYLFTGKIKEGKEALAKIKNSRFEWSISSETIAADFLENRVNIAGIKTLFLPVDENKASILYKQKQLEKVVEEHPLFRAGLLQLATTHLQLHNYCLAQKYLEQYEQIDGSHPVVYYYLTILFLEQMDYNRAWNHLRKTELLLKEAKHHCKAVRQLRTYLRSRSLEHY